MDGRRVALMMCYPGVRKDQVWTRIETEKIDDLEPKTEI
jgi:hypothetical protein